MNNSKKLSEAQPQPNKGYLSDYSERDKPWDGHRSNCDSIGEIYATEQEFKRLSERMNECSERLTFGWHDNKDNGESQLKLKGASFCRVRHCPVCQWRRSLMWQARFYQALPQVIEAYPKAQFIFATFTVRNCEITDLRETLQEMNKAWQRLIKRKEFRAIDGWIRTTEVTRNPDDDTAHPHFHCLLMVRPSYFGKDYLTQAEWTKLWQSVMRLDYTPIVDVRKVRKRKPKAGQTALEGLAGELSGAISETLKYAVKPSDILNSDTPKKSNTEWLLELTRQVHKLRFIATGGGLKDVLKLDEETNEDLIKAGEEVAEEEASAKLCFDWKRAEKRYKKTE